MPATQKARTSRIEQKEATREQLLEAATTLLAENGYAALRVAAVAAKAGVSLGGQLHHFPSKDELVAAVLERLATKIMAEAEREASRVGVDDDILLAIAESAQRFYSAPEFLINLDIFLSVRRHTFVGDTAIRLLGKQRADIESLWLPTLTARGVAQEQGLTIIRAVWGLCRGLAISTLPGGARRTASRETLNYVIDALRQTFPLSTRTRRRTAA